MLQSARIPLSAFTNGQLTSVRGLRVTFNSNGSDEYIVTNVRVVKTISGQP